jgi:hypothetical protein
MVLGIFPILWRTIVIKVEAKNNEPVTTRTNEWLEHTPRAAKKDPTPILDTIEARYE